MINNSIYVRRKQKIILNKSDSNLEKKYISSLLKNISSLGFSLSEEVIQILKTYSLQEIDIFHKDIVEILKDLIGAHAEYKPMYPNFPKQVEEMSELELHANAFFHYLGDSIGFRILPRYQKENRKELNENVKTKVITLGSIEDFNSIFTTICAAKTSISDTDKNDIEWFIKNHKDQVLKLFPKELFLKENIALIGAFLMNHTNVSEAFLKDNFKTATDILRLIVALCYGDISLAETTRFKKIRKKHRKLILRLLEDCSFIIEDMLRYKEAWKRIGERIHPFEYKKQFPKSAEAFNTLRNKKPFESFNGKIEKSIISKDLKTAVETLKKRPGELARRLDQLLRINTDSEYVLKSFQEVSKKVSSPVLLQVLTHFKHRNKSKELRIFFPKGSLSKVAAIGNDLPKIEEKDRQKIVKICKEALIEVFKEKESLGSVYLDKNLKKYTVPFALRSASKALRTIGRGSAWDLPKEKNIVRFFIWWKDGKERTDIDLSAVALDKNHNFKTSIAYFNLKELGGYHSGDITSAPRGASEFIDIDISKFIKQGNRYIMMSINSYTSQPFCDLPECFAGVMSREKPNSGEIYEPKTVETKFDVTSNTKMCIPLIVDLEDRKVIWTDISLNNHPKSDNNVYENMSSMTLLAKAMTTMVKPSLFDLFQLHIEARGIVAEKKKKADTIFSETEGVTPFDTEEIIANFL